MVETMARTSSRVMSEGVNEDEQQLLGGEPKPPLTGAMRPVLALSAAAIMVILGAVLTMLWGPSTNAQTVQVNGTISRVVLPHEDCLRDCPGFWVDKGDHRDLATFARDTLKHPCLVDCSEGLKQQLEEATKGVKLGKSCMTQEGTTCVFPFEYGGQQKKQCVDRYGHMSATGACADRSDYYWNSWNQWYWLKNCDVDTCTTCSMFGGCPDNSQKVDGAENVFGNDAETCCKCKAGYTMHTTQCVETCAAIDCEQGTFRRSDALSENSASGEPLSQGRCCFPNCAKTVSVGGFGVPEDMQGIYHIWEKESKAPRPTYSKEENNAYQLKFNQSCPCWELVDTSGGYSSHGANWIAQSALPDSSHGECRRSDDKCYQCDNPSVRRCPVCHGVTDCPKDAGRWEMHHARKSPQTRMFVPGQDTESVAIHETCHLFGCPKPKSIIISNARMKRAWSIASCCQPTCSDHVCGVGFRLKSGFDLTAKGEKPQETCCEATCENFQCNPSGGQKYLLKEKPREIAEPSLERCCRETCWAFACDAHSQIKPTPWNIVGPCQSHCCDKLCSGYQCSSDHLQNIGVANTIGFNTSACCTPSCANYVCPAHHIQKPHAASLAAVASMLPAARTRRLPAGATAAAVLGKKALYPTKMKGASRRLETPLRRRQTPPPSHPLTEVCCDRLCSGFTCAAHVKLPKMTVTEIIGYDDLACCDDTCASFPCPLNKLLKPCPETIRSRTVEACCDDACSAFPCHESKMLQKDKAATIRGNDADSCCVAACSAVQCGESWRLKVGADSIAGFTRDVCCDRICANFTCSSGYKIKHQPQHVRGNSVSECCDADDFKPPGDC